MTTRKAVINSQTTGRFALRTLAGREHIVTAMVPIVGDTVMNGIYYPDAEVAKSFAQFNDLPAPAGHPVINGEKVSAFHPLAINIFNVGGFTRNPKKSSKKVTTELWLDTERANNTDEGVEIIRRIKAGEKVGVSTGLGLNLENTNGTGADGVDYTSIGSDFAFDHTALLLNEKAAGDHVGTELILNKGKDDEETILVCEVSAENASVREFMDKVSDAVKERFGGEDTHVWLIDVIDGDAIYEVSKPDETKTFKVKLVQDGDEIMLGSSPVEVEEKKEFVEVSNAQGEDMEITLESATKFLTDLGLEVVDPSAAETAANKARLEAYETQRPAFEAWQTAQTEALNTKRASAVEKTEFTDEQVANMDEAQLDNLITLANSKGKVDNSLRGGGEGDGKEPKTEGAKETASTFMDGVSVGEQ